jgi:multidrug efflux pump subunit AcrA (membrane-fusion protein)
VHFAIQKNDSRLRVGQFVNVVVPVDDERSGLAIPRSSIVRAPGGGDMVFEHTSAEIFVPRRVRIEPLDAENVLVSSGVEQGQRIVIQGAELLDHVR